MIYKLEPEELFEKYYNNSTHKIIDVRSPGEFAQGHIPGAYNVPLLSDDARVLVGTMYKNQGKSQAVALGFEIVTPNIADLINQAKKIAPENKIIVYCARGGMRSRSVAQLLDEHGFCVKLLFGGYKLAKNYLREQGKIPRKITILSGKTGSGKTKILHELKKLGEQVLDLEALANHRGSVFGDLGMQAQPTQQQFALACYMQWISFDSKKTIFIEDESKRVGNCFVPDEIFEQMQPASRLFINISCEMRINNLVQEYGIYPVEQIKLCVMQLSKRLGGACTKELISLLEQNNLHEFVGILLEYYDKKYVHDITQKNKFSVKTVQLLSKSFIDQAKECLNTCSNVLGI